MCTHVKKSQFHKRSITDIEEFKGFDQSASVYSVEMISTPSIRCFFDMEEEDVRKSRVLCWAKEESIDWIKISNTEEENVQVSMWHCCI